MRYPRKRGGTQFQLLNIMKEVTHFNLSSPNNNGIKRNFNSSNDSQLLSTLCHSSFGSMS